MRHLRPFLAIVCCLLVAATPAGAGPGSAAERPPTWSQLKRQTNEAAARYDEAQTALGRLDQELEALQVEIAALEAEVLPLREVVTRRTVALYQGARGFDALAGLATQSDPVVTARGARLVSQASAQDVAAITQLADSTTELRQQQEALQLRRQEKEAALGHLAEQRRAVEGQLVAMERAQRAQRVSRASARQTQARAAPDPVDRASIPVVTDLICPIRGPVAFSDTWGAPRSGGRRHRGTDLMSPHGTDNVAVVSGEIQRRSSAAGGITIYLYGDDGTTYMYMHLSEVVGPNRRVAQGELIGKTGNTGNARGGSPHTHFEIHPGGGPAINPYPTLAAAC